MTNNNFQLDPETKKTLKNIEYYLKILVKNKIGPILEEELKDPNNKKVYALTGEKSARDIETATQVNKSAVSALWKKWEKLGILVKEGRNYKKVL